jgi:hypothetical protein
MRASCGGAIEHRYRTSINGNRVAAADDAATS